MSSNDTILMCRISFYCHRLACRRGIIWLMPIHSPFCKPLAYYKTAYFWCDYRRAGDGTV